MTHNSDLSDVTNSDIELKVALALLRRHLPLLDALLFVSLFSSL